jgi:SPP1 family predicted phage head-tail adaptor
MSRPEIGELRRRVTLQAPATAPDGGGGFTVTWNPVTQLWAQMRALSGTEIVVADGLQGRVTHEFVIRKRSDVSPAMRLTMGARIFVIWAVLDRDGPDPFIRVQAEERLL